MRLPRPQINSDLLLFYFMTGLAFVDGKLVISMGQDDIKVKFDITTVQDVFADMVHLPASN